MFGALLAAFLTTTTADAASSHRAIARGGQEAVLLTNAPWAIDAQLAGTAGATTWGARWLWTHQHRRLAATVLIAGASAHALATWHNSGAGR